MTSKIKQAIFQDFIVPYGGAFCIERSINLEVKDIRIINIYAYSSSSSSYPSSGAGFIFSGQCFSGSCIFGSELTSKDKVIVYIYSSSNSLHLNDTCFSNTSCSVYSIMIGKGPSFSKGLNCSLIKATSYVTTLHFSHYCVSYYQSFFIASNCSGPAILGHSCSNQSEQKCENMIFVNNVASSAVLGFFYYYHRIINGYFIGNSINKVLKYDSSATVKFESCYHDDITGMDEDSKTKTFYKYNIESIQRLCSKTFNKCFRTIVSCRKSISYLFLYVFLVSC